MWWFPKLGVPQNGWFLMENPIKLDDLGVPHFRKPPNRTVNNHFTGIFPYKPTILG